jgi:hypothetical protein
MNNPRSGPRGSEPLRSAGDWCGGSVPEPGWCQDVRPPEPWCGGETRDQAGQTDPVAVIVRALGLLQRRR